MPAWHGGRGAGAGPEKGWLGETEPSRLLQGSFSPVTIFFTTFYPTLQDPAEKGCASNSSCHLLHPEVQDPPRTTCMPSLAPSGGFAFSVCFRALQIPHHPAFPAGLGELAGTGVPVSARGRCHPSIPSCLGTAMQGDTGCPLPRAGTRPPSPCMAAEALLLAGPGWAFPAPGGGRQVGGARGESLGTLGGRPQAGMASGPMPGGQCWEAAVRAPGWAGRG